MRRTFFIVIFSMICTSAFSDDVRSLWNEIKPYILKSEKCMAFEKIKFFGDGDSLEFHKEGKPIKINSEAQIPYELYSLFYKELKKREMPFVLNNKCGDIYGEELFAFSFPEAELSVYPLLYRSISDFVYEIIILTNEDVDMKTHVGEIMWRTRIFSFIYDENKAEVLSSLILFSALTTIPDLNIYGDLSKGSALYDDVDYYVTHSIDNNIYTIYANKDVLGVQLGGLNGFEIYKLSTGLLRYEKVWSSIRIFPEEIPSSVLKTVKNKDEIIEVVYNPMGYECEIIDVDGYTNVREKPNSKAKILYTIKEKERFVIDGYSCGGWYRVIFVNNNLQPGWIHKSRVKKLKMLNESLDGPLDVDWDYEEYDIYYIGDL